MKILKNTIATESVYTKKIVREYIETQKALEQVGFRSFAVCKTTYFPFALLAAPLLFGHILIKEVSKLSGLLQLATFHPLYASKDQTCVVFPLKLGVKFYSMFSDGLCLITNNCHSHNVVDYEMGLIRQTFQGASIEEAYNKHCRNVEKLEAEGRTLLSTDPFKVYCDASDKELDWKQMLHACVINWVMIAFWGFVIRLIFLSTSSE